MLCTNVITREGGKDLVFNGWSISLSDDKIRVQRNITPQVQGGEGNSPSQSSELICLAHLHPLSESLFLCVLLQCNGVILLMYIYAFNFATVLLPAEILN